MKSIKKQIQRTKSFISIKTYKRPLIYVIMFMVLLNLVILIIAAVIALAIDDSFQGFFDAFFNGSLKWMLTPNAILTITNPKLLALAVVILLTGLILFSGTIIALTTNAIKDYFQSKKENSGKIELNDHVVILNWNSKVPELVADLLHLERKALTIMIVSMVEKSTAENQIIQALKRDQKHKKIANLNVLVKQADPLFVTSLMDISIEQSSAIIIMNKDNQDLSVIKNLLSIGPLQFVNQPPIIVEIKEPVSEIKVRTLSKAVKELSEHEILPVCFDQRLGQIIAQTILEERLEEIYLSLFSFEGSEVYPIPNKSFDEVVKLHTHAIPLMANKEMVFALSLNEKTAALCQKQSINVTPSFAFHWEVNEAELDIYIIGNNSKLPHIVDAFSHYEAITKSKFQVTLATHQELTEIIAVLNKSNQPCRMLLLSDDTKEFQDLDQDIIESLINLESTLTNTQVSIVVEILNPKHSHLIQGFSIRHTIVSNKIISLLLSKLALHVQTESFYHELLTIQTNGQAVDLQSIHIAKASHCIKAVMPLQLASIHEFVQSVYQLSHQQLIPFGRYQNQNLQIFEGDLWNTPIQIDGSDDIIFMQVG